MYSLLCISNEQADACMCKCNSCYTYNTPIYATDKTCYFIFGTNATVVNIRHLLRREHRGKHGSFLRRLNRPRTRNGLKKQSTPTISHQPPTFPNVITRKNYFWSTEITNVKNHRRIRKYYVMPRHRDKREVTVNDLAVKLDFAALVVTTAM